LRMLAVGGVVLSVWGIEEIAKHYDVSPSLALAIGVANPIVVLHLVGGGHNDALLMGLLTAGFALALRGRWRWGVGLVGMAAAVKLPAAAGLVYLGWNHPGVGASVRQRLKSTGKVVAVSMVGITALGAAIGVGLGWITAAKNTGATTGTLSFTTQAGYVLN